MKREARTAYGVMFGWMILAAPTLVLAGHHFGGVVGALAGFGAVWAVYAWRYWVWVSKMNPVWDEEASIRE